MRRLCKHCGDSTGTPDFDTCGRCAVLLDGLGDVTVAPPGREPGCDDRAAQFTKVIACERSPAEAKPRAVRDGKWLAWAAAKRGQVRWFHAFGVARGYPRNISQWSPSMVAKAIAAKVAEVKTTSS